MSEKNDRLAKIAPRMAACIIELRDMWECNAEHFQDELEEYGELIADIEAILAGRP